MSIIKIIIKQAGFSDYQLALTHLIKLFFEDVECQFVSTDDEVSPAELQLQMISHEDAIETVAAWHDDAYNERVARAELTDEQLRSASKRALFRCVLQLLQKRTGLRQPWGILTGVRPTKLMHQLLRKQSPSEVQQALIDEYLLTSEKAQLLADIVMRQRQVIPDLYHLQREVSLYIGIPFCPTKCAYCTFPAYDIQQYADEVPQFLQALIEEIRETGRWLRAAGLKVTTIYWGGGTPTSITAEQMALLLDELEQAIPDYQLIREITVEAGRPDTITVDKIELLRMRRIDRMSINPQSFTQSTLDTIGRHHTVTETIEKFHLCRQHGMNNLNMDLIIGLPDEGVAEFTHTISEVEQLMPESLTVHTLSFKRASKMTKQRDAYEVAERHEIEEMMELAERWMNTHGYQPYYLYRQKNILGNLENVGYALAGKESLYNILMMEELQTIIGIGCGAVSKIIYHNEQSERIERFANPKEPAQYNATWRESLAKKIALLNEAYDVQAEVSSNLVDA